MLILIQLIRHFKRLGQEHVNELIICLDELSVWDREEMGCPMLYFATLLDENYGIELTESQCTMIKHSIDKGTWESALKLEEVSFK